MQTSRALGIIGQMRQMLAKLRRWSDRLNCRVIAANDEGLEVIARGRTHRLAFSEMVSVAAEKVSKVTYDEVFLIILGHSGDGLVLGELDDGFANAEQVLRARLAAFPSDWWARAEQAPVGVTEEVWAKAS